MGAWEQWEWAQGLPGNLGMKGTWGTGNSQGHPGIVGIGGTQGCWGHSSSLGTEGTSRGDNLGRGS